MATAGNTKINNRLSDLYSGNYGKVTSAFQQGAVKKPPVTATTGGTGNSSITTPTTPTTPTSSSNSSAGNTLQNTYTYATDTGLAKSQESQYDDELAQLARQGNYDAYFKKATQNSNINRLAQKYLGNTLKQQGLESTGEGTIGSTNLSNAYLNAQADALSDFNTQEQSITESAYDRYKTEQNEAEAEAKENYSNWASMLQTASSSGTVNETLEQILADNPDMDTATANKLRTLATAYSNSNSESSSKVSTYQGYMSAASNAGNLDAWYTNNVENNDELSDTEKSELAKYYEAIKGDSSNNFLDDIGVTSYSAYSTADELKQMTDNDVKTGNKLSSDIDAMTKWVSGNKPSEGTLFHLMGSDGEEAYIYYDPSSGSYYRLSSEQAGKYSGTSYTSYKGNIVNSKTADDESIKNAEKLSSIGSEAATKGYGFPANPKIGDTYSYGGRTYRYSSRLFGSEWVRQ